MSSDWSFSGAFPGTVSGVVDATHWIETLSAEQGFPDDLSFGIQLCVEELFANVVRHGGGTWLEQPDAEDAAPSGISMSIKVRRQDDEVTVVLEDNGTPFDVAAAVPKPVDRPIEAAQPGGLGIQLINKFSSGLTYDRAGGLNRTTLKFLWPRTEFSLL
jgi:serine/threonine-protein kinase RsbW